MSASTLKKLLAKGYQSRTSAEDLARLLCQVVQAEERGLPPDSLFETIDEGLGKRASLERITAVVVTKISDMLFAQKILRSITRK